MTRVVTVQAVERGARRCALCHDDLALGAARACPGCGTATHGDCRAEAGGCPSLGCPHARTRVGKGPAPATFPRDPSPYAPVSFGAGAAGAATLAGLAAGLVATGGRTGLPPQVVLVVALIYALVGTFVAGLCRILEQRLRGEQVRARLLSWSYLPLALVALVGARAVHAMVMFQDSFGSDPFF